MKIEIRVPSIGESVSEVTLSSWLVEDGATVAMDEPICEFESDKATLELPAEQGGVLTRVAKEGDDLKIGDLVAYIETEGAVAKPEAKAEPAPEEKAAPVTALAEEKAASYAASHPSPAAKKILDEKGINPADVNGTGVSGRITKEDAIGAAAPAKAPLPAPAPKVDAPIAVAPAAFSRNERVEKLTRLRKTISRRLVEVKNQTAMLTTFNEVDMTRDRKSVV